MQEELFQTPEDQCPVIHSQFTHVQNVYEIIMDTDIREPSYYRDALSVFRQAGENDEIRILANSNGGSLATAIEFRNCIAETKALVVADIRGDCHSAMSMICLSADIVEVKPYSSMMIHSASFGSVGTAQNIVGHVNFTSQLTERVIRDVYQVFLSEDELNEVLRNREIWLTDEEIRERWNRVMEVRQVEMEEMMAEHEADTDTEEQSPVSLH